MVSRYVSSVPVKPEGLCLLPPPHQSHYRMLPPQRSEAFHVTTPPTGFVQNQNQPPNPGGSIRGMAPTGPPTQASTPPQNDQMKQMSQPSGQMPPLFVSQPVRPGQNFHYRAPPSNPGGPRMTNHHRQVTAAAANQMYPPHVSLFTTGPIAQPMPYQLPSQPYPTAPRGPPFYPMQQYTTVLPGQFLHSTYPSQQPQAPQQAFFPSYPQPMTIPSRQVPQGPAVQPNPQATANQTQPTSMTAPLQQQQPKRKKRDKAIPIINPKTGKEINDDVESLPPSGDSSARETPQPNSNNMQVVADFAARVAIVASEGKLDANPDVEQTMFQQQNAQPSMDEDHMQKMESVVQNSKLQVSTKEFVPEVQSKHVPKENCAPVDSNRVEVPSVSPTKIKPNKQQQQSSKELETVYINKELIQDNKLVKVKADQPKIAEPPVKESTPTEEPVIDKSKRSQQKSKEVAAAPTAPPKQSAAVPGSQPPKATSKGNKMRELNRKGDNKEGTDMDAISIPETPVINENCNEPSPIVNQQSQPTQPQQQQQSQSPPPPQLISQAQPQVHQTPPIRPKSPEPTPVIETAPPPVTSNKPSEVKTIIKNKVDVTSIVKEMPKANKPFTPPVSVPPVSNATESQDETDRVVTEKLVQVKNEANIKANSADANDNNQVIDKNTIRYKKDQWSPINQQGKKIYDRDFLIGLQNNPECKKKPDNLPDIDVVLKDSNRTRIIDPRAFNMGRQPDLMPPFHSKSVTGPRGLVTKRGSQQGGKNSSKSGKQNAIHVTLSLKEDVKLRETENAWRPARLSNSTTLTEDEMKTAALYKKVRGVLNKLTPEKFEKLLSQVQELTIDNAERLQGVIDLVFEKAVDEPNFSVAYANMCKELALMQVPADSRMKSDTQEYVNFRKLLITRCQIEFEKNSIDEKARNLKLKEIEECADPEKKKEMQLQLEEEDRRMRIKSVGNIRFIGELFKQQMLTVGIMLRCINILLENKDEDSLECLCKLLTTIGKDLEHNKKQDLSKYFEKMQEIADKKYGKISSRVRFMLQDVIDLRNSKWVPRRQDQNPKTMEQIQKEADTEQLNIQMNSGPMNTPRKEDRLGGSMGSDRKRRNNTTDECGWSMATSRSRPQYTVESHKLMNKPPPMEEMTLGSKTLFGQWGRGSNIKTQTHAPVTNTTNMYAALENINSDQDKSRSNYDARLKDTYVSKGPSMERYKNYDDNRGGSRSGSQHRSSQQRPTPSPSPSMKREQQQPSQQLQSQTQIPQLTPEQFKLRVQNIMDEFINDCLSLSDCTLEIKQTIEPSKFQDFVLEGYNNVLDCSITARNKAGKLFAHLIKSQILSLDDYCKSLKELLSVAEDLVIDVPKLWDYLAEMIVPLITEEVLTLDRLATCMDILVTQKHSHKLLAQLLRNLFTEKGPNYIVEIWQLSAVSFTNFMSADLVNSFIKDNKFDFMVGGAGTPAMQGSISWEQVHNKLLQLLKANSSFDSITDWISANIGENVSSRQFIRILVTAICENAAHTVNNVKKLKMELVGKYCPLLQRYIDNQEEYELQCLFALQSLVHKWEHPPGLLLTIFEKLWEDSIIANESVMAWAANTDPAEQEGKGVALASMQRLFTALNEAEEDSTTSEDERYPLCTN